MSRAVTVVAALGLLTGCAEHAYPQPPANLRGGTVTAVRFVPVGEIDTVCRQLGVRAANHIHGCTVGLLMLLPNPCEWATGGAYRDLACHELGHINGWGPDHP